MVYRYSVKLIQGEQLATDLNDERRAEPFIQNARQQWVLAKVHPANDDPQQLA
jgi:hypothetical protein